MLTFAGRKRPYCDGQSRREFLSVGALAIGGLTLADLLRFRAQAESVEPSATRPATKSVIMIYLAGGPTHIDSYDLKPNAASEFRGEFNPIKTNVPGVDICELMPKQAQIMDKLAIIRGIKFLDEHSGHMVMTGFSQQIKRPSLGCVVSYLKGKNDTLPPYVSLMNDMQAEDPAYLGVSHRPFITYGPGIENLGLVNGVQLDRLQDRKSLLRNLDTIRREIEISGELTGVDSYTARALDMVSTSRAREAFDTSKEPVEVRERYGKDNEAFLKARRLVEAGVPVVTLAVGGWDTHANNFKDMRTKLPRIDQAIHALVSDLHERGLSRDVATVMWGEFGRTPRINNNGGGRDHWAPAGFALMSGGNFKLGQALGETDSRGERAKGEPFSPSNVLAALYRHLGINPGMTVPDHNGRPMYLLEDREPVKGLV